MDPAEGDILRLFLAGDVMTGRGIDQILSHPVDPRLYESWVTSAEDYVRLAERRSGPIPRGVDDSYIWGDLLGELQRRRCDLRIINLETAITTAATPAPKGINYRMNPANVGVLTAARIDACTLANNHVLDWGGNWGHEVPIWQRRLGRALIEQADATVVFGHSSHHPKAIESIGDGIVFYGCGDLISDYEGITGHEAYRPHLGLAIFLDLDRHDGRVRQLDLVPVERRRFRLQKAGAEDAAWLAHSLAGQSVGLDLRLMANGAIRHHG